MNELTREQIMDMPAGRELDSLVAEHVMGIAVEWTTGDFETDPYPISANEFYVIDEYSTDIATAWDLLKEINEKGLVWRIEGARVSVFDPYVGSPADDGSLVHYEIIGSGIADTICKAALLAVLGL